MPIPDEYKSIIEKLISATAEKRVVWTTGRYGVTVSVPGAELQIWAGFDEESGRSFISCSLQAGGRTSIDTWSVDEGESDYSVLLRLHNDARRQGLGIPEKLAALEAALDSGKVVGQPKKKDEKDIPF